MPPNVEEFSSVRFLAILWVVCRHMSDPFNPTWIPGSDRASPLPIAATYRVGVAVDLFVTLSGFVMAYVYAERSVLSGGLASLGTFYLKRFDRVLLVTWLSFGLALMMSSSNSSAAENAACFLLANTWVPHPFMCFEGGGASPSWTISALTAHWLLYPLAQPILTRCGPYGSLALASASWLGFWAYLLILSVGSPGRGGLSREDAPDTHLSFAAWTPAFLLGLSAGAVTLRHLPPTEMARHTAAVRSIGSSTSDERSALLPAKGGRRRALAYGIAVDACVAVVGVAVFCSPVSFEVRKVDT